jgi:leader peptidase (prepilin peptidase)/N-methyltransferase
MTLWEIPLGVMLAYLFCLGAVVGSFLNVCIYRIPRHETVIGALRALTFPPSSCPHCARRIRPRDNIPILGWMLIGGRCRFCRNPVSIRYPAIELLNGLLVAGLYWAIVPGGYQSTAADSCLWTATGPLARVTLSHSQQVWLLHAQYVYYFFLVEALLVATFIDFDLKIIPDGVTVPAMFVGFLGPLIVGRLELTPVWATMPAVQEILQFVLPESLAGVAAGPPVPAWIDQYPRLHGLSVSVAGFLVGGGAVWLVRAVGQWILRREAMGFGDVILLAMIGSFMGWQAAILVFFLAPVFALLVVAGLFLYRLLVRPQSRQEQEIPYGPYLSLAALVLLFDWRNVWPAMQPLFSLGPLLPMVAVLLIVLLIASLLIVQGLKWSLGIPLFPEPEFGEWTSADQLQFFSGYDRHERTMPLRSTSWPGEQTGRGSAGYNAWRR